MEVQPRARRALPAASWACGLRSLQRGIQGAWRGRRAEGDPIWTGVAVQRGGPSLRYTPQQRGAGACVCGGFRSTPKRLLRPVGSLCWGWGRGEANNNNNNSFNPGKSRGESTEQLEAFAFHMKLEMKYENEPHEIADLGRFCLLEKGSSTRFSVNAQSKLGVVVLGTREAGVFAHKHTSYHTCCYPRVPRVMESEIPPSLREQRSPRQCPGGFRESGLLFPLPSVTGLLCLPAHFCEPHPREGR